LSLKTHCINVVSGKIIRSCVKFTSLFHFDAYRKLSKKHQKINY